MRRVALCLLALIALTVPAAAQELKIGLKTEPSALDPQYHNLGPNNQIAQHLFDPLIAKDPQQRPVPALALSWKTLSDTVWEFTLRPDVKFHDGAPFTADDVVFTFERAAKVPNSPSPFTPITRQMTRLEIIDPLTVRADRQWIVGAMFNAPIAKGFGVSATVQYDKVESTIKNYTQDNFSVMIGPTARI